MSILETLRGKYKTGTYKMGRCSVTVEIHDGLWHLSISTPDYCSPSYNEVKAARYKYIPDDVVMADLYPSKNLLGNVKYNEKHLWEIYLRF
jgi:hypothetical protein